MGGKRTFHGRNTATDTVWALRRSPTQMKDGIVIRHQVSVLYCRSDTGPFIGCFDTSNMRLYWNNTNSKNVSVQWLSEQAVNVRYRCLICVLCRTPNMSASYEQGHRAQTVWWAAEYEVRATSIGLDSCRARSEINARQITSSLLKHS